VLPGGARDPRPAIDQAATAERLGLGTVFVGERYDTKDLPSLVGALSQTTSHVRLAGAVTHIGTRHPMALASMCQTLQMLTGGRFVLGFGRGSPGRWRAYGLPVPTIRMIEDTASVLRRLWAGERVAYAGPAGAWPALQLVETIDLPPPLLLAAVGPETLALGGRAFDAVILHPLLTPEAVARSVGRVREAASTAGRDPDMIEVHATVVVAPDCDDTETDEIIGARGLGYLLMPGLGDALVAANAWDATALTAVRTHPRFAGLDYNAVKRIPVADLAAVSRSLPPHWLAESTATGTATACAARLAQYLAAGADGILLHGSTIDGLVGVVEAFTAQRREGT
jgi:probable F420-dependent oxidoreductase